jgi:benzoate 4-monooxygenase
VVSVPTYTIHRSRKHWGDDVEDYRPERWLEDDPDGLREKAFNPFSHGTLVLA